MIVYPVLSRSGVITILHNFIYSRKTLKTLGLPKPVLKGRVIYDCVLKKSYRK